MMKKSAKMVSVIIPTYNYAHYISEAIESVLNQTFPSDEIEIIVIDDGSEDDTPEIIKKYKSKLTYLYQNHEGKAWATKVGIEVAKGKYIFNLDADDIFLPNKIEKVVDIFEKDEDIVHVSHPAIYWNVENDTKEIEPIPRKIKGQKIKGQDLLKYFYHNGIFFGGGSTFAGKSEILKKIFVRKEIDIQIDEYLVWFTLKDKYSFFIDEPLSIWRIHGKNFSIEKANKEKIRRVLKGVEAVLSEILKEDFEIELKKLYLFKSYIVKLLAKEIENEKSFSDVIKMWKYIFTNFSIFDKKTYQIIMKYKVLNRSLPTFMLKWLKSLRASILTKYKK
jgi:glycosyltransferase involved in cell wall biosynthesis